VPEFSKSGERAVSELLNAPHELLMQIASGINGQIDHLVLYRDKMKSEHPGLIKHAGAWVGIIQKETSPYSADLSTQRIEGAFTAGNLMTYELLSRTAYTTGIEFPDPPFLDDSIVDAAPPTEKPKQHIEIAIRGADLPKKHDVVFEAVIDMLARNQQLAVEDIKNLLFGPPRRSARITDVTYFIAGAAEVVLPIERHAQVTALERYL